MRRYAHLFVQSLYEVSLFHLCIAFYAILITASSSYNINNDYDMSETSSLFGFDFAKSNYCAKSNWFRENQYVIKTFSNVLTIFCFQFCWVVNFSSILNIFIEVVLAISSKIYTNDKLISRAMLISLYFRKTDFAKSTGVNRKT